MVLNYYTPIKTFWEGLQSVRETGAFRIPFRDILLDSPEVYGFSILRKAILTYEREHGISEEEGKSRMPFYRQFQRRLIGPELIPFVTSLYEEETEYNIGDFPHLVLTFDYQRLAEHCLSENVFLFRCKYEEEASIASLKQSLEREYDKVFFDAENTGFAPDSRFVSLLYNALLEIRPKKETPHKEWRLALFKPPEEADYLWEKQTILPITTWDIPLSCLVRIELKPDYREMPELYTALIGWMKHCGLVPEQILTGLVE